MGKPSFIVIGMERAGTTSLYHNICKHSQVLPAYCKEIEYFDRHYDKGDDWYHLQFKEGFTGEATPTYYWNPQAPERIRRYNPDMKIILLKRPFEDIVFSKYNQQVAKGVETLDFENALAYEHLRTAGELERTRALPYNYYPTLFCEYSYKERYSERHLYNWEDFDMLILEQGYEMKTVFEFLGLDNEVHEWDILNQGNYNPMTDQQRALLRRGNGETGNSFSSVDWANDDLGKR